jgi:mono/diheme cytochrome c family protein
MRASLLLTLAAGATSLACGSSRPAEPLVETASLSLQQRHGQALFHRFCHQCHPNGEAGLGPAINSNPAPMPAFRAQVRAGLGAMPSFPESIIADRELTDLLAYVDAQRDRAD